MTVPLLFCVSTLTFVLVSLTPGNAARQILGLSAPASSYTQLRKALGLDYPLYEQYWHWLERAVTGNLGASLFTGQAVTQAIAQALPVTLALIAGALLVSFFVGGSLGAVSAIRGGRLGRALDGFVLVGWALPAFWVGAELIELFAVKLRWLPATGYVAPGQSLTGWLRSLALPVFALSLGGIAVVAKQTREAMLDVLGSEHIRMAWANGLSARSIYTRHAMRNAAVRVVTVLGVQAVWLLGGTVIVENIFALPGLGSLVVNAATEHDLPIVQGVAIYFTLIVVVVNLLVDGLYTWLDPRVRTG